MKITNVKGITLIALIITIIVMLILVAVTISVALNGELFNNASDAKTKTQRQAEKEELIAKMVGAYNSDGNFTTSNVGELPNGAKWCTEADENWADVNPDNPPSNWIITKNNNKFYVDSSGSVLDKKPEIVVDNLIPTPVEKEAADENEGIFYIFVAPTIMAYAELSDAKMLQIVTNSGSYVWYCEINTELPEGMNIEPNKWYFTTTGETFTLYTGSSPIKASDFSSENIKSESYFNRVIASFSSTNN